MTTINAVAINPYPLATSKAATAAADDTDSSPLAPVSESKDKDSKELRVNSADASIDAVKSGGDPVKALQKQIEQTQKLLAQQQQQLASIEKGQQATDEQKAQQVMEMQAQITTTSTTLQVLQAALLQAMFSVDVHA
nr:hypothetical protein FFPRI1PSEUD_55980 [Pseudomonas sp. FFPRI_1]